MASLQKNVASQNITFCLVTTAAGIASTSTSTTVIVGFVCKDATQAAAGGTWSCVGAGNGQWNYSPTQSETNCTDFGLFVTATGAIPSNLDFHTDVVDANGLPSINVVDIAGSAVATGSAQLGVNVVNWAGGAAPATSITGVPKVDLIATLGTSSVAAAGAVAIDWAQVSNKTSTVALTNTTVATVTSVSSNVAGSVGSVVGAVGSVTGAVGSVTGNVGGNVVGTVTSVTSNVAGSVTSVSSNVVGSVGSVTGAVGSVTGAVGSVTGNLGGNVVGSVASVASTVSANVIQVAGSTNAATILGQMDLSVVTGTATSGTSATVVVSSISNPASLGAVGQLIGRTIIFLGNTTTTNLQSQASNITASTTGATPTITYTPMTTAPANGDTFVIV